MKLIERCSEYDAALEVPLRPPCAPFGRTRRGDVELTLPLAHGGSASTRLRYEAVGPEEAPVLFVAGGISADRHVIASDGFADAGWWQAQAASFGLPTFRLLALDWIGADGAIDLPIDPADQADAIAHLLDYLGIDSLAAFIGASYGAMVGLHFAARYRERCAALLAISAPAAPHPYASACRSLQRRALALGEAMGDRASGVSLARAMAMLTYRTPEEFADRFAALPAPVEGRVRVAADDYLDAQGNRHVRRMSSAAYRRLSESIDLHRIDPSAVHVPVTCVAVDSDALVPAVDIEALARAIPGATLHHITSRYGHDAFLKEEGAVAAILSDFISSLELAR